VIGGSSSTNYCFAVRARPSDHEAWVAAGNEGWGYDDVLPYYKAMENYVFGDDKWHGRNGVYTITRADGGRLSQAAAATVAAGASLGIPMVDDLNAPGVPGFGLAPLSVLDGVRQSTAIAYLDPVRGRANLEVRGDTLVDRIVFDRTRATGVLLADGSEIEAGHIVLSAGTYNTPTILLRSGIGPAQELVALGVEVLLDAPGVGKNLMEHPVMFNIYAAKEPVGEMGAMYQIMLSAVSEESEVDYDLQLCPTAVVPTKSLPAAFVSPVDEHPTGWDMIMFSACVQPHSRGSVTLLSTDPTVAPIIDLGLYSDPRDAEKVAEAVRIGRRLTQTSPLKELIVGEREPGPQVADEDLADAVRRAPSLYNHPSGTAKMGPVSDPTAVVGSDGSVHHLQGLSVADASIFPTIPRVPTNPTAIVVAEKISAALAERLAR
jgi:choline dehydrogenase